MTPLDLHQIRTTKSQDQTPRRDAGFSVAEIGSMLGDEGPLQVDRDQLMAKATSIDQTIRRLTALSDGLRHAAVCTAPSNMECPRFKRLFQVASKHRLSR